VVSMGGSRKCNVMFHAIETVATLPDYQLFVLFPGLRRGAGAEEAYDPAMDQDILAKGLFPH